METTIETDSIDVEVGRHLRILPTPIIPDEQPYTQSERQTQEDKHILTSLTQIQIAPAAAEGIEEPPAEGAFPWAPSHTSAEAHLRPSNAQQTLTSHAPIGSTTGSLHRSVLPEYSVSIPTKGGNGSTSFHQDSNHAVDAEDSTHGPGIGLMDPNSKTRTQQPAITQPSGSIAPIAPTLAEALGRTSPPVPSAHPSPLGKEKLPTTKEVDEGGQQQNSPDLPNDSDFYTSTQSARDLAANAQSLRNPKIRLRQSWLERKCCKTACPASCGGYNFVKVFVILSASQVIIACIFVWLVGYLGLLSATNELSAQVREAIMDGVSSEINSRLQVPLRAASNIHYVTRNRFSDIDTRTTIQDTNGYLADLFHLSLKYPDTARLGFLTRNNIYVTLQKSIDATDYTSKNGMYISINDATTQTLRTYQPKPIPERNIIPNKPPIFLSPEIHPDDSAAFITNYLGSPVYEESNFSTMDSVRFIPSVLAGIQNSTVRELDPSRKELEAIWSVPFTAQDRISQTNAQGYLTLSASIPQIDPQTGELLMTSFAYFKLSDLERSIAQLAFGEHGIVHIIRAGGDILASTDRSIQTQINSTRQGVRLRESQDEMVQEIRTILLHWGLMDDTDVSNISVTVVPYTPQTFAKSFKVYGQGWRIEARMLNRTISALPYTVVLITSDKDFDGGVTTVIQNTAIVAGVICFIAVVLTFAITRCITRPLLNVVAYMKKAIDVISMDRGQLQREALADLCHAWSIDSGMIMPPLIASAGSTASARIAAAARADPFEGKPLYASFCWLCNDQGDTCCCYRVGRSLREVQQMHAAYGSLLYTLASYDELEAINQAKRQFIRYIFHEVRVPFNAIVMGIEQMQLEMQPHQLEFGATIETLDIIKEQSQVVSRILNDVLSMQKIEDGALALEYDNFSLDKMIRGALYAFRTPCLEKRLKVRVNIKSLDDLVSEALPGLRLGKVRTRMSKGSGASGRTSRPDGGKGNSATGATQLTLMPPGETHIATAVNVGASSSAVPAPSTNASAPRISPGSAATTGVTSGIPRSHVGVSDHSITTGQQEVYHAQVRGDPYRLRQSLANFVSNAIKFTPIGGLIRVSLDVSRFEVNPLASIASDQLLLSMGLDPKQKSPRDKNRESAGGQLGPASASAQPQKRWHQSLSDIPVSDTTSPPSHRDRDIDRHQQPIVPELLGTVMVRVSVRDSGPGIPLEHQDKIFSAYAQIQAGKIQKGNGTGLGLNITRSIVELHGGQIGFTSDPSQGGGTEFHFSLPMDVMLVRTGSKGEGSSSRSYGNASRTARSSLASERKLETIAASPEQAQAQGELPSTSTDPTKQSVPSTPNDGSKLGVLPTGASSASEVELTASIHAALHDFPSAAAMNTAQSLITVESVHGVNDEANDGPRFHDESALLIDAKDSPRSIVPQSRPSPPKGSHSHLERDRGTSLSSTSVGSVSSDGEFYGSTTSAAKVRPRGLRGANLGVSIPTATNTQHAAAQNLTASVKNTPISVPIPMTAGGKAGGTPATASSAPTMAIPLSINPLQSRSTLPSPPATSSTPPALQGMRVLVVEDSQPNRKLLMSLLTHMGCVAYGVENGQECVDLFKDFMSASPSSKTQHFLQHPTQSASSSSTLPRHHSSLIIPGRPTTMMPHYPFDCVLMDGSMPVMNGVEATQVLRQHGILTPIIAVTGNALAEDQAAFLAAGADGVLTKPINKKRLQDVLALYVPMRTSNQTNVG